MDFSLISQTTLFRGYTPVETEDLLRGASGFCAEVCSGFGGLYCREIGVEYWDCAIWYCPDRE